MIQKRKNQIAGILFVVVSIVSIGGIWIFQGYQNDGKTTPNNIPKLIEVADSLRNSVPDSAISYYNRAKTLLESFPDGYDRNHLLASSYVGIAFTYSQLGDLDLALKNDSIALAIALKNDDKPIQAKALNGKGLVFSRSGDYPQALSYYKEAMSLATEVNDLKLKAMITSNRAMIYAYQGDNKKAINDFSETLEIAKQTNNKLLIAGSYMNLGFIFSNFSENEKALENFGKAQDIFTQINDLNGILLCYQNLGSIAFVASKYDQAIDYYQLSINLSLEMNDKTNAAVGYHNLAEVYVSIGDYIPATDNYFKSIKIKEQLGDKKGLAMSFAGLGNLYFLRNDYNNARIYYKKSLAIDIELGLVQKEGTSYSNIAGVLSAEKNDSALIYYNKALELQKQVGFNSGISNTYASIGNEYMRVKNYSLAEGYLNKALHLKIELSEKEEEAAVRNSLAELFLRKASFSEANEQLSLYKKAEDAGLAALNIAKEIGAKSIMRDATQILKKIYQKQGSYQKALGFADQYNVLTDSLFNKNNAEALVFAQARWNVEKKQQEITTLENTQKLDHKIIVQKETEAKQHKFIIWILVAVFLLAIATTTFIALYIRKRRDALYQKQLTNIAILRMQNIRNALSPHFVFNVLNNIWAIIDDRENARVQFDHLINLIRRSLINTEKLAIPLNEEIDFVKSFIELQKMRMDNNLEVIWNIEEGNDLAQQIPGMILQIPVENAIKHGLEPKKDNRLLLIDIKTESGFLKFNISDNGLGLQQAPSSTIGTGTGLKILTNTIHILNQINDDKMSYQITNRDVEEGPGTKVIIKIPLQYNYNLN